MLRGVLIALVPAMVSLAAISSPAVSGGSRADGAAKAREESQQDYYLGGAAIDRMLCRDGLKFGNGTCYRTGENWPSLRPSIDITTSRSLDALHR